MWRSIFMPHHAALQQGPPMESRLLRRAEVVARTGLSQSTIDRRERAGTFPRRVRLGDAPQSPVAWSAAEVADWVERQLARRSAAAGGERAR
jgi:prophage regulatory protein